MPRVARRWLPSCGAFLIIAAGLICWSGGRGEASLVQVSDTDAGQVVGGQHTPCGYARTSQFKTCYGFNLCWIPPFVYYCPGFQSEAALTTPGDYIENPELSCTNLCGAGCGANFTVRACPAN